MYNDRMPTSSYEIRVCLSCGLRYPLVEGHPFGTRCPVCSGETRVARNGQLRTEISPTVPSDALSKSDKSSSGSNLSSHVGFGEAQKGVFAVLLDNIRSAWNVGSILRSADGLGFTHAYLCGITPTPENEAVTKTSLGAEDSVPWSYHKDAVKLVKGLKTEGWKVYGLEQHARAIPLESDGIAPALKILIVGNEVTGVDPELLELCDKIFYIPMRGEKKSFNVAIAFGIAAYALRVNDNERLS